VHTTADGRNLLVIHGDAFDGIVRYARWLAFLGDHAYNLALWINGWFNRARRAFGLPYWSLSAWLKHKVKNAVKYIDDFEVALATEARRRGLDGVVCGHIHKAEIRDLDGLLYCNDGDWVESLTALVETHEGELRILTWDRPAAPAQSALRWDQDLDPEPDPDRVTLPVEPHKVPA
jgi:UDP-2,3-diacylglucosamine pyrophosphatase LpxH